MNQYIGEVKNVCLQCHTKIHEHNNHYDRQVWSCDSGRESREQRLSEEMLKHFKEGNIKGMLRTISKMKRIDDMGGIRKSIKRINNKELILKHFKRIFTNIVGDEIIQEIENKIEMKKVAEKL